MVYSTALPRLFHIYGTNPGSDSAYTPVNAGMLARPCFIGGAAVWFGGVVDGGNSVGQSYERGLHPPR